MNKRAKILIIGFGSIGSRHYFNLKKLGFEQVYVFDAFRQPPKNIKQIAKLSREALKEFTIVFVCSPTSDHIKTALVAAQAGCHLFIEKPLSHSNRGINELIKICKKNKLITMVGCNLRFNPAVAFMKAALDKNLLGRLLAIYVEYGRYLPYQRPGTDYTKVYAAHRSEGGGAILDDIHDFDLISWFNNFVPAEEVKVLASRVSKLKIDVEDVGLIALRFKNNVVGSIRCDYLQQYKHRELKIIGEKSSLVWNFRDDIVWREWRQKDQDKKAIIFKNKSKDQNKMYVAELKYFLNQVVSRQETQNSVERAADVLKLAITK